MPQKSGLSIFDNSKFPISKLIALTIDSSSKSLEELTVKCATLVAKNLVALIKQQKVEMAD